MATRQKLIHLHKSTPLVASAVTAVDMVKGEIAVRHAATNAESELYTLNNNGGIVSFPSKAYVDDLIDGSSTSITNLQGEVNKIETAVGLNDDGTLATWATGNYITGKTTFKAAIEALDTQAKANAAAAAAAKSVVSGSTNITVTPKTDTGTSAVTYTVAATGLVTTTDYTKFKDNIVGQTGVDGNSDGVSFTDTNYLTGATSLKAAIEKLAIQAKANADAADAAATTAAKHTKVVGANNISVSSADTNGQVTYTVDGKDLATVNDLTNLTDRVVTIEEFFNGAAEDSGATKVIDTLKEIQDYITKDTTGASEMTAKLANITTVLGGYLKDTNGATGNTVIKDIIDGKAEKTALADVKTTVNNIKAQAGVDGNSDTVTFDDTNYLSNAHTLKAAIEKLATQAKTNATEAAKHTTIVAGTNISVTESTNGNQGKEYTISTKGVATETALSGVENRVKTIEDNYVDTITITKATDHGIDVQKTGKTYTIDLDSMIIDCGEY